ncbi:MAG: hypothetical protein ACREYB_04470, partial [Casimicrobiaceae bacterium]
RQTSRAFESPTGLKRPSIADSFVHGGASEQLSDRRNKSTTHAGQHEDAQRSPVPDRRPVRLVRDPVTDDGAVRDHAYGRGVAWFRRLSAAQFRVALNMLLIMSGIGLFVAALTAGGPELRSSLGGQQGIHAAQGVASAALK